MKYEGKTPEEIKKIEIKEFEKKVKKVLEEKKREERRKINLEDIGQILPWYSEKEDVIRPRIKLIGKKLGMFRLVQAITGWSDKEIVDEALSHFLKSKYVKTMLEGLREELKDIEKEEFWMGI
jgi:hypothetical protein